MEEIKFLNIFRQFKGNWEIIPKNYCNLVKLKDVCTFNKIKSLFNSTISVFVLCGKEIQKAKPGLTKI